VGSLSAPPDPLAAIWGLLLRGEVEGEGRKKMGRGGEREKRNKEGREGIGEVEWDGVG